MNERALRMRAAKRRSRRGTRVRSASLGLACLLAALSLWPALAVACPPVLRSVTVGANGNNPTSVWSLPANVTSQFVQTSESSDVDENGYFRTLVNFNTVSPSQTTFSDPFNFPPGVYYLHVAGHDSRCKGGVCSPIEFSNVMSFEVTAAAAAAVPTAAAAATGSISDRTAATAALDCSGTGGPTSLPPLPSTSGGPGPDRVAPFAAVSFAAVQDVDRLFVTARMSEAGKLTARATVSVAGASKIYRFRTVSRSVAANVSKKLRLKLTKKRLKAVKRALRKRKRLKAKVTVTAIDKAGNRKSQKLTIRLTN